MRDLCTLQFVSEGSTYEQNLDKLLSLVELAPEESIVLAPEVCVTNFDYDNFNVAAEFSSRVHSELLLASRDRTVVVTMIERLGDKICNVAKVYSRGAVIHTQRKVKLFELGGEQHYFCAGDESEVIMFEIDGIKIGILICFELRFISLWQRLRGADIIAIPAQWGRSRADDFDLLGRALAVTNQCFVMQSDTKNSDTTSLSGIIKPSGEVVRNKNEQLLTDGYLPQDVRKTRRYLNIGLR